MSEYRACINKVVVDIKDKSNLDFRLKYNPTTELKLNDTGKIVLEGCIEKHTVSHIVDRISKKYDVEDKEVILKDVLSLLSKFFKMGMITWENDEFPWKDEYEKKKSNYTLKEYTVNNVREIFKEYNDYVLNAYSNYKNERTIPNITSYILSSTMYSYKIEDNLGNKIKLMVNVDNLVNQLIIKAIQVKGETINKNMFDDLILWILERQYKHKYYLEDGLESIPVIIFSNNNDMIKYALDFNFKKVGVLEKEVNNEDIDTYIKYYEVKDFR